MRFFPQPRQLLLLMLGMAGLLSAPSDGQAAPSAISAAPACAARTSTTSSGFGRIETPVDWNYRPTEPSTSACRGSGRTYEVGPGKALENPRDVPWLRLQPCDTVLIHWRPEPYRDVLYIGARGEPDQFITIKGVPGPKGERPVFDGNGAIMPSNVAALPVLDVAGMIMIAKPNLVPERDYRYKPGYLHISGLKIQNVRAPALVTDLKGQQAPWKEFTAAILVNPAEHLVLTDNEIADSALGLFANSLDEEAGQTRDMLIRGNYFHGNGVGGGKASQHNAYTEGIGTVYEYNYFGPPLKGSGADNIKDRSAGIVFRYNHVEQGVNLLSLRDPQSNRPFESLAKDCLGERLASSAFVYANTFVATNMTVWDEWPIIVGHGDGIYGGGQVRDGKLYFYGNRVISRLNMVENPGLGVPLFSLLNTREQTTVVTRNNLFYAMKATPSGTPAPFALFYWQGIADFQSNWINRYVKWMATRDDGGMASGIRWDGHGVDSLTMQRDDPGFEDAPAGNYRLKADSPFHRLTAPLPDAVVQRDLQPMAQPVAEPFEAR